MLEHFRDLYKFRALVSALVTRHLSARYRGSVLGYLWSILNPLSLMLVYFLVFKFYIRFSAVENYHVFLFCGLLPWIWFTSALIEGTSSITSSGHLITKSMFPAHLLPAVSVITNMINFLLSLPLLIVFMLLAGVKLQLTMLLLPLVIIGQFLLLLGLSMALSSLNVIFRDVQHILSNLLNFLFFLCPIVYPSSSVPERFRFLLDLNPVALMAGFYHSLIMDGTLPTFSQVSYFVVIITIALLVGSMLYNKHREEFAELL